jgi:hypothetical protein
MMADRLKAFLRFSWLRWRDMGDGTVAPVVSSSAVVMLESTTGELFPRDCDTQYGYDTSGLNILTITKTTADGRVFEQFWDWDGQELRHATGWIKQ